jgi:hypothetical protein
MFVDLSFAKLGLLHRELGEGEKRYMLTVEYVSLEGELRWRRALIVVSSFPKEQCFAPSAELLWRCLLRLLRLRRLRMF